MKNANIERLNAWAIDAHILDEAKVEMNDEVRPFPRSYHTHG